jgi:MerR family redox-sensitive transcriptional activator SoxR
MATLPADRAPDATEWSHVARPWRQRNDHDRSRTSGATHRLHLTADSRCGRRIYNPGRAVAQRGAGVRSLLVTC